MDRAQTLIYNEAGTVSASENRPTNLNYGTIILISTPRITTEVP